MKLKAMIYHGTDADITLPIRLLKEEGVGWEIIEEGPLELLKRSRGRCNPVSGWYVHFPAFDVGTSRWTGIYTILSDRGLLYC